MTTTPCNHVLIIMQNLPVPLARCCLWLHGPPKAKRNHWARRGTDRSLRAAVVRFVDIKDADERSQP
jgi:hypothetical protein